MATTYPQEENNNANNETIYSFNDETTSEDGEGPATEECCCSYFPKRYLVAGLAFLGFLNVYALRVNMSVAIVSMATSKMRQLPNGTEVVDVPAEFDWDPKLQGFLLSSFFYGYIFTQIPGDELMNY